MMIGKLKELTMNRDGSQNITITVHSDFRETYDELADHDIKIDIKKYNPLRSLDASARAWVMIDEIAEKTGERKYDVYRKAIQEIGGVSEIVCVKDIAAETLCRNWRDRGEGWMAETNPSKLPGCTNVTLWYGSSVYDSKQMSDLINSLVQEANNLGIPTMSPKEEERLLAQWGKKYDKKIARQEKTNGQEHSST